ncbi:uncharacterized protein ACO6RY_12654 [Pungitius sinensis]
MNQPLLLLGLSLPVLFWASAKGQNLVGITFLTDPVLVQTGAEIVFTVLTVPQVFSMQWQYQGGVTVAQWTQSGPSINQGTQFNGRTAVTANQLRITGAQLRDAGAFTVTVVPDGTAGLLQNSKTTQLRVFEAVAGVTLLVPSLAVEGRNVSLSCTWTSGTEITVQWGKGGASIPADPRITISAGSLVINPAIRGDAGQYACTASNPVSAQTDTRRLTVYYGPDTPVLTKVSQKVCVGGGDVMAGQTVLLTCTSDSLPPALFSWQRDGQAVAPGQPDSGVLTVQTLSTPGSARYVCTARNSLLGTTSQQGTDLSIVATCLDVGEVVGIVIGCLLLILIIVLLIVLIVFLLRRRRAQPRAGDSAVLVQKTTDPHPRPIPPDPLPNGARDLGQGPPPPLYHLNTHTLLPDRLYTDPPADRGNLQPLNGLPNADTRQHDGRTRTNGLLRNASQNANSYPHNGIDNRTFAHTDGQNAAAPPNPQPQNGDIIIQTGAHQVRLNTLEQNNRAQMPTIHVNLTSYPNTGQQARGENSFPLTDTNNALQSQQNVTRTGQSNPGMQSGQSYPSDPRLNGHQDQPGLIQTGHTHHNGNDSSQRNANTQTYRQEPEPPRRSNTNSWDLLRGTPTYPSGTLQRGRTAPEYTSDYTDYTTHPPIREARAPTRSQPPPRSRTTSRSRAAASSPPADRRTRGRSADLQGLTGRGVTRFEAEHQTQRGGHTQRAGAQRDIRGPPGSQSAPGQEATHDNSPQALPLASQRVSAGRSALPQGPRGADSRALADPNHLPQAHMAQQHRAAPVQTQPQGPGKQTHPVTNGANRPGQGGAAPVPHSTARRNPGALTQAALTAHTEGAQVFQSRREQTRAALLHSEQEARVLAARHAPTPPPAIPLAQFQTLPPDKNQHRSPARGLQPAAAQRPARARPRHADRHRRPGDGGGGQPRRGPQPQKASRGRPR